MTKELSIENIKKELIDKISNNSDILEYFENYLQSHKHCLKEYGMKYIKDNFIFANDMSVFEYDNFISVEVTENELLICGNIEKCYNVNIIVTFEDCKDIDTISIILGNIATELYPDRSNYKNTVYSYEGKKQLIRVVQFTIR
ncbi:hypothetical protein H8S51_011275 [Roseburia rectibacter]|jgi:hypothetical protein|uniref:hypothetical protein n=1 Tax=Roseburia rectibacter TaxID=2763062 RepID=UPI00164C1D42|nr:hypothetical protein [Roseburia rectibacter]UMY98898.1 hypothetical protein H8S51_011275 [Roseburia rectibacter]